jgi:hypothetical protein
MNNKVAIVSAVLTLTLLASPVLAQGNKPSTLPTPRSGLSTPSLKACQAKESSIKTRMESLTDLSTNIEKVFDSIATRIEDFYTNKVIPSGKTVGNYGTLVADIASKKVIVTADLATAQKLVDNFSCTNDKPKTLLTQFRLDMQKVKQDLKNYRTSIKNLLVAVKGMAPSPSPKASESSKPTESPNENE